MSKYKWVRTYNISPDYVEPLIKLYEATHIITKRIKRKQNQSTKEE